MKVQRISLWIGLVVLLTGGFLIFTRLNTYLLLAGNFLLFPGAILLLDNVADVLSGTTEVRAKNSQESLRLFEAMLRAAKSSILLTSGTLASYAYVDYQEGAITNAIQDKLTKGLAVKIVCGKRPDPRTLEAFRGFFSNPNFEFYVSNENPVPHGLLVDRHTLRIEDTHPLGGIAQSNVMIKRAGLAAAGFQRGLHRYINGQKPITQEEIDQMIHKLKPSTLN